MLIITNLNCGITHQHVFTYCPEWNKVCSNIIKESVNYNNCILVNDVHRLDDWELKYIPNHFIYGSYESHRLIEIEKQLKCSRINHYTKNTLSLFKNTNIVDCLKHFKDTDLYFAGFIASLDVLPSCIDAIQMNYNPIILESCIGDVNNDKKNMALEYLNYIGVKIV